MTVYNILNAERMAKLRLREADNTVRTVEDSGVWQEPKDKTTRKLLHDKYEEKSS